MLTHISISYSTLCISFCYLSISVLQFYTATFISFLSYIWYPAPNIHPWLFFNLLYFVLYTVYTVHLQVAWLITVYTLNNVPPVLHSTQVSSTHYTLCITQRNDGNMTCGILLEQISSTRFTHSTTVP